jgi:hypothetical protein
MINPLILFNILLTVQAQSQRIPFNFYNPESSTVNVASGKQYSKSNSNANSQSTVAVVPSLLTAQSTLIGTVSFGEPAQPLNILFDTGSSLFWVINAQKCNGVVKNAKSDCPGQYRYSASHSKTFVKNTQQQSTTYAYGGGSEPNTKLNCQIIGYDSMSLGNVLVSNKHPICAADYIKLQTSIAHDLPYDGIMGLAPKNDDPQAIVNVINTFMPQMRTVSFWYNRTLLLNQNFAGEFGFQQSHMKVGMIVFGYDEQIRALYSQKIATLPIAQNQARGRPTAWMVQLQSISVGGKNIPVDQSSSQVLVDTGNPGSEVPTTIWNQLYKNLNPRKTKNSDYLIDCSLISKIAPITFSFYGSQNQITLQPAQQVLITSDCTCMLVLGPNSKSAAIGSVFLSSFFTVFDYQSLTISFYATNSQAAVTCGKKSGGKAKKIMNDTVEIDLPFSIARTRNRDVDHSRDLESASASKFYFFFVYMGAIALGLLG